MPTYDLIIGIDPGTKTGLAIWNPYTKKFEHVQTLNIVQSMQQIRFRASENVLLVVENPNTWVPFNGKTKATAARAQGAGSVKRDFAIWKEFAEYYNFDIRPVKIQGTAKKVSAEYFKRLTGWVERTSEHARDAGMLVYGMGAKQGK